MMGVRRMTVFVVAAILIAAVFFWFSSPGQRRTAPRPSLEGDPKTNGTEFRAQEKQETNSATSTFESDLAALSARVSDNPNVDAWLDLLVRLHRRALLSRDKPQVLEGLATRLNDPNSSRDLKGVIALMMATLSVDARLLAASGLGDCGDLAPLTLHALASATLSDSLSHDELLSFWTGAFLRLESSTGIFPGYRDRVLRRELGLTEDAPITTKSEVDLPTRVFEGHLGKIENDGLKKTAIELVRRFPRREVLLFASHLWPHGDAQLNKLALELYVRPDLEPAARRILVAVVAEGESNQRDLLWMLSTEQDPSVRETIIKMLYHKARPSELDRFILEDLKGRKGLQSGQTDLFRMLVNLNSTAGWSYLHNLTEQTADERIKLNIIGAVVGQETQPDILSHKIRVLSKLLGDSSLHVRRAAVNTLWLVDSKAARVVLEEHFAREPDASLREIIREKIAR